MNKCAQREESADLSAVADGTCPAEQSMKVLDHIVQADAECNACFDEAVRTVWRAFFANCAFLDYMRFAIESLAGTFLQSCYTHHHLPMKSMSFYRFAGPLA